MNKCIFIDRDGTLNIEKNYLHKIEEFEWEPGAKEALRVFKKLGYTVIIITNQAGIGRGYYTEKDVDILHKHMIEELKKDEITIDAVYYCPHYPGGIEEYNIECSCRKPGIGNFERGRKEFDIDYSQSYMIGDRITDLEPAVRLGMVPVMVKTGYGSKEADKLYFKSEIFENIYEFSKHLENQMLK